VVGEDLPTFVAEVGVHGGWAMIGVRAVSWLEGGFFGEDSPEHACGNSGVDESVGGGKKIVMIGMEMIFEGLGACGEFLL